MEKIKKIYGVVKSCGEAGWCFIDGEDGVEYLGYIKAEGEICGPLKAGQRVTFFPDPGDCAIGPIAVKIRAV